MENEHLFEQLKMKCSRLSLNRSRDPSSTSQQPNVVIDLTVSDDDDDNENSHKHIDKPPSPNDFIILPHVKPEPTYLRNETKDELFFNWNDDIVTHSEHSDSTYLTTEDTDPTDIEPFSSPSYIPNLKMMKLCTHPSTSTSSESQEVGSNFFDVDFDPDLLISNISHGKPFPPMVFCNHDTYRSAFTTTSYRWDSLLQDTSNKFYMEKCHKRSAALYNDNY